MFNHVMNAGVVVAIIAAFASLLVALLNAALPLYRERRAQEASAKTELDRTREPLLAAALDLADRIDNIRHRHFLEAHLKSRESRRSVIALTSSLHRFAKYWCIVETLYDKVALLQFREDAATRPVADTLRDIGRTFATDSYDGGRFMVWREEQRAIAEKMRADATPSGCIGYASFAERYRDTFAEVVPVFVEFGVAVPHLRPA